MLKKISIALLAVFLLSGVVRAETITFATDATWPPMEFVDANGQVAGFAVDYMNAAGKEAGFTPEFKVVAWDGIFAGLATGKYDAVCSSVSITGERKKVMDFSIPYFKVRQALIVPADSTVKSLDELKGKKVGAQIATTGYFAVRKVEGVKPKSYDEIGLAIEDLYNGRIDAAVCDDPVAAQYALRKEKYKDSLKIGAIIETGDVEHYGIAIIKGNAKILDLVNTGIKAVQAKGLDKEILDKWIGQ